MKVGRWRFGGERGKVSGDSVSPGTLSTVHRQRKFFTIFISNLTFIFASCTNFNCDINLHSLLQLYLKSERAANTAVYLVDVGIPVI